MDTLVETPVSLLAAALNLMLALLCGGLIGSERQVRQRMAGLRTNALVALGAASFVVFSGLFPQELSPTRVGAQVVSGIGFLGAGIIFRHGFTVHGLNTAATLWCSAAVGLMAGAGAPLFAILVTGLIIFVNLGLRPLVKWIKSKTSTNTRAVTDMRIHVTCRASDEAEVRRHVLDALKSSTFKIEGLERMRATDDGPVALEINICILGADIAALESALAPLLGNVKVSSIRWEVPDDV